MSQLPSHSLLPYDIGDRPVPGYTLRRYLGGGAIGHVWMAETDSGFQQAIKVIDLRESGGRKEFRGLRTVKQRHLLSGYLLTLIDYWLKDATGTIVPDLADGADADSFFGHPPASPNPVAGLAAIPSQKQGQTPGGRADKPLPKPSPQGTLVHGGDGASPPPAHAEPLATQSRTARQRPVQLIVAMELGHKTLFDRMKECQADGIGAGIPLEELLPYVEHAARGLDYLHRNGILHRDVKPHNIMLVGDVAKVCDYGLVVATDYDLSLTTKAYTPYYASPEAIANKPLTGRTDQYSLAVAYVEVRAGRLPYADESAPSVYLAKETGSYDLHGIANSAARKLLTRALAKDPRERFATCLEFVHELAKAERSRAAAWPRRIAAALAVVLAILAGAALAYEPARSRLLALVGLRSVPVIPDPPVVEEPAGTSEAISASATAGLADMPGPEADIATGVAAASADPVQNVALADIERNTPQATIAPPISSPAEQALARLQKRLAEAGEKQPLSDRDAAEFFELFEAAQSAAAKLTESEIAQAARLLARLVAESCFGMLPSDALQEFERRQPSAALGAGDGPSAAQRLAVAALGMWLHAHAQANGREQLRLYDESLRLNERASQAAARVDPFQLASLLEITAGLMRIEMARLTPIVSADESRRAAAGGASLSTLTKYDHLQRALLMAHLTRDAVGPAPPEAQFALGLVHESLAYDYKLAGSYEEALAAFQATIEAGSNLRLTELARVSRGRCALRSGWDARVRTDVKSQRESFRVAQTALDEILQSPNLDPRIAAEAHWRLAQLLATCASEGPSDLAADTIAPHTVQPISELQKLASHDASRAPAEKELKVRLRHGEAAAQHFKEAARLARDHWKPLWPTILREGLQARLDVARHLLVPGSPAPALDRSTWLADIATDAATLLAAAHEQPTYVGPDSAAMALIALAATRRELPIVQPGGLPAALAALREGETLFDRPDDAWRAQRVTIVLEQTRNYAPADLSEAEHDVQRAEAIAREIHDAHLSMQARGECLKTHADLIYEAHIGAIKTPLPRDVYLSFDQAQQLYAQAETALARADDPRTEINLKRLRGQRSLNLKNGSFRPDFTELEKHRLQQFIGRTLELRTRAASVLMLLMRGELGREYQIMRFSESASPLARSFCNLLVPVAYAGLPLESNLAAMLQVVEHKLSLEGPR